MARSGSRRPISSAEVTVPVVISTVKSGALSSRRPISTRTEFASPTLAAWIQASGPSGRVREAMPNRSA